MKKTVICLIFLFCIKCIFYGEAVEAQNGSPFSVLPIITDSQETNTSYFDLKLESGQSKEISVDVFNDSAESITVIPKINLGRTSTVGNIHYQGAEELDSSLDINIEDIVITKTNKVKLQPNESKRVTWIVQMPEESFDGILLGGLRFILESEEAKSGIENRFAYTIGVVLKNNEKEVPVNLNFNGIKPGQLNYRNHFLVNLQNDQARIIDELSIDAEIFRKGEKNPLYTAVNNDLRMAPQSSFNYAISTNETSFKPGKYLIKMTAVADEKEFSWEKEFEIKSEESNKLNKEAIIYDEKSLDMWKWITLAIVGISISIVIWTKVKEKGRKK